MKLPGVFFLLLLFVTACPAAPKTVRDAPKIVSRAPKTVRDATKIVRDATKIVRDATKIVRDAQGHVFTVTIAPRRIVSLAPGTTEMLFALGLGKHVVGDTTYCDYPPAAKSIAKIGDVTVNYEKVIALHPDLVVASDANATAGARLRKLRVPVFAIAPTSYMGVEEGLVMLGKVTGTEARAQVVVANMQNARAFAARAARLDPRRPTVLPVVGVAPLYVAGSGTFIGDLIALAGGQSAAYGVPGYAPYSKELVLARAPDFVLADPTTQATLEADPVLSRVPAVRFHRFIVIDPNILNRPGPRLADALGQMSRALHPTSRALHPGRL